MFSKFSEDAQKVLLMTKVEMMELKHPYVSSEHLLLAILHNNKFEVTKFLNSCGLNYDNCRNEIVNVIGVGKSLNKWFLYTPLLKRIIENSIIDSKDTDGLVTVERLFVSLLEEGDGVANRILMGMNIDVESLYEKFSRKFVYKMSKNSKKLMIDEFSVDFNKKFNTSGFDPVVGREILVNKLIEVLLRRTKNNPLLIGDAGVGKTAIVEEFVRKIEMGDVPSKLCGKRVLGISMSSLIAGTKYRGEFEERINQIIDEVVNEEDIIIFIDEIHTLVGAGGAEGAIDASNILKPYLARGSIKIIGATTFDEYSKYIEKDKALDRRFQKIIVKEPSILETKNILLELRDTYEKFHNVKVSESIVNSIVDLCDRYISKGKFPDKAIDVFDEVCAKASVLEDEFDTKLKSYAFELKKIRDRKNKAIIDHNYKMASALKIDEEKCESDYDVILLNKENDDIGKVVTMDNVYEVIFEKTQIPISNLKNISDDNVYKYLKSVVLGQDKAINKICKSLLYHSKISKNAPLTLLLVGKSGTGKTFFVKQYAKMFFSGDSFIRLDMSEFKNDLSSNRILGSPPGYVGYDDNSSFLDKVKFHPYSVILLDEVEKASSSVLKLFLQIFDEGSITNSKGEVIDFSHTIIFMTSNLGTDKSFIGFSEDNNYINDQIKSFLGVELFNRIDDVVIFEELSKKVVNKIILSKLDDYHLSDSDISSFINKIILYSDFENAGARKIDYAIRRALNDKNTIEI